MKDEKAAFARRLNDLCDFMGIPPKGENRQAVLGKLFDVSQKGARKWLEGEGFPNTDKLIAIAKWGGWHFEYLISGRGPRLAEYPTLRADIEELAALAETMPTYKVQKLIAIGQTLAEPDPGDVAPPPNTGHPARPGPKQHGLSPSTSRSRTPSQKSRRK